MSKMLCGWILVLTLGATSTFAAGRDALWKKVDEAIQKGLPRTAITNLEIIVTAALQERAYGEVAKAIARKVVLEGNIQGNKAEEKITRMEAEIAKAPKEIVPLLDTVLADWYWHYFQNNRWRFLQRTATARQPGKDFTTWDLPRLFDEIDKQFTKSLAGADTLKKVPVSQFDVLLQKGTLPDTYRPTLYDFIANEALKFYTSAEQAATKAEDEFEISANSPIFDSADSFIAWKAAIDPTASPRLKAIALYQDLLKFHQKDKDPTAFIDTDIARLQWGSNVAFGENKADLYKAALKAVADKWADHELSAQAHFLRARAIQQEGRLVDARELAQLATKVFPNSMGAKQAGNLVKEIEAKSAGIVTERVWNAPWPRIEVRYKNVTQVHFRAVAWDWDRFLKKKWGQPGQLDDRERKEVLGRKPELEWSARLPVTADFKERVESIAAPGQLKPGYYMIVASHEENFTDRDNQVTFTDVWVSDLALVVRPRDGQVEGFVLEANSGEPVAGAEVLYWQRDNQGAWLPANGPVANTDEQGFFAISSSENRGLFLRVRHQGRELAGQQEHTAYKQNKPQPYNQTVFFTDRALYRPGQTIQYKGIALRVDQEKDTYDVLAGRAIKIVFSDPNGKEVAQAEHRCNDYGSFSGSFTAPRDRLAGRYSIRVTSGENGSAAFNVEEYKRPKFQVTLDAPKTAAKLNDKVSLQGKAESYTGAAVDGAQVKWHVVREVRWPAWWDWYGWGRGGGGRARTQASQEIAHGTARTEADGSFQIEFLARPDPSVSPTNEVSFSFSVSADVTDTTGETRSAQRGVLVGFTALSAGLSAEVWQTDDQPVVITITTTTLDGEALTAEGSLKIYRLKEPAQVQRARLGGGYYWGGDEDGDGKPDPDLSNPNHWELDTVAEEKGFTTDKDGKAALSFKLGPGPYRAMLETRDRFGKKVTARMPLAVLRPGDTRLVLKIPHLLAAPKWSLESGQEFMALWGTGYEQGRAFVEIEHRHKMIQRFWTKAGDTQQQIKQAIDESMRGGFTLHVTQVRENRGYLASHHIDVPWSNKDLEIKWEHFVSKLEPSQKETWTAVIMPKIGATNFVRKWQLSGFNRRTGQELRELVQVPMVEKAVAEMVATLYDESLDAFMKLNWQQRFSFFRQDYSTGSGTFENGARPFQHLQGYWPQSYVSAEITYRMFPPDFVANFSGYEFAGRGMRLMDGPISGLAVAAAPPATDNMLLAKARKDDNGAGLGQAAGEPGIPPGPDLSQVSARKNLNETAFFFPQLISDVSGIVKLQFTMPEALTQWRFLGFAHDKQVRSGFLSDKCVTAKDLMVQPNPPRFLREGDVLEFTVKVSNQTAARQEGKVKLALNEAFNGASADAALELRAIGMSPLTRPSGTLSHSEGERDEVSGIRRDKAESSSEIVFDIPAKESRSFSWRLKVPDAMGFLTYKAVGSTGRVSDGEEGFLPVLSRRIFVTESLPLPIRGRPGGGEVVKKFEFTKLLKSGKSDTLRHQGLTVQMVSNPSWYAVMALPYLMEFPHECTEQTFNRLYANALARSIANADPKIRRVFDQWKGTAALDSPMEKNQDLKAVMLEETPWLRQANSESQARKNVGILFDDNRLTAETAGTLRKLEEMQLADGLWPWFPGGRGNDYITLYITTGFGRLRHLGVDLDVKSALKSLARLDEWMDEHYRDILKWRNPEDYVPSATDALYLYGRSFFLKDKPVAKKNQDAIAFFLKQSRQHWLKVNSRQSQGHLAIAVKRFNAATLQPFNDPIPSAIMKSIKERSVASEEMGMFWRETELSWWWYRAPIETQALMIEAFDEVMGDAAAVEECRVWLLKQKQAQDWKTTKATADAVYALLLRGRDMLAGDKLVEISLGGTKVTPGAISNPKSEISNSPEAGTGFYEKKYAMADIKPKLGEITVRKLDPGVAWGSVHWQYLEDMAKVTPYEGTPLKLKKSLFTKSDTKKGKQLEPVKGPLAVGDELVVRIELRVDRDMEYVHLKDQRGSGTEPVNVISRYKYQDGLAYYETTRDTASHFFIDYLPKGTYVFEYSTRIQHRGQYQTGVASIQCMYAPEFNSHSESLPLVVK